MSLETAEQAISKADFSTATGSKTSFPTLKEAFKKILPTNSQEDDEN